jgi:hypothetical protein
MLIYRMILNYLLSGFPFIGHGDPNSNLESLCLTGECYAIGAVIQGRYPRVRPGTWKGMGQKIGEILRKLL